MVGSNIKTKEFADLVALLEGNPLAEGGVNLATAKVLWPTVEGQIHPALAAWPGLVHLPFRQGDTPRWRPGRRCVV